MNKAYKVVFNKLRGTMMVVNETTSSVQTGKKAAVTVALMAALISGTTMAADADKVYEGLNKGMAGGALSNDKPSAPLNLDGYVFTGNYAQGAGQRCVPSSRNQPLEGADKKLDQIYDLKVHLCTIKKRSIRRLRLIFNWARKERPYERSATLIGLL